MTSLIKFVSLTLKNQFDDYENTYNSIITNAKPYCESKQNYIEFCVTSASEKV